MYDFSRQLFVYNTEQEQYHLIIQMECEIQCVRDKSHARAVVRETEGSFFFFNKRMPVIKLLPVCVYHWAFRYSLLKQHIAHAFIIGIRLIIIIIIYFTSSDIYYIHTCTMCP